MMILRGIQTCAAVAAVTFAGSFGAFAQSPAEFYKGKTINIVVGFSAGGGYDQYARLLARHLAEHIPGKPNIVVQNAPGAGSLTAVKRIESTLPKDGTAIVTFNPAKITESLTDAERIGVNFGDFNWLGSITRDFRVCYVWHTTGIKNWDDVAKRKELIFGATSKGTGSYVNGAILRNVFDIKLRHVLGFPGSAEQRLAIERGELQGDCGSWSSIPDEWVREKKIVPFVMFSPVKTPDMPDLPFIGKFAKTPEQKSTLQLLGAAGELGRPFIVSKDAPKDRVEALRKAFDATMKDPEFLAEAKKQGLPVYPADAKEAEETVRKLYKFPKEVVERARKAMD